MQNGLIFCYKKNILGNNLHFYSGIKGLFIICSPFYNLLWYNKRQETVLYCFRSIPPPLSSFLLFLFARRPVACDFFCPNFHFLHIDFHRKKASFMRKNNVLQLFLYFMWRIFLFCLWIVENFVESVEIRNCLQKYYAM